MIGILLATVSTLFGEIATAIGKFKVHAKEESIYQMGFLDLFFGAVLLLGTGILRNSFRFAAASLPTFGIRAILEIAQAHTMLLGVTYANRSTFAFVRTLTIPLLLLVDVLLGYAMTMHQLAGVALTIVAFIILFANHGLEKKGIGWVIFGTVNAVATLSLYKYDISHFNSVEAEQSLISIILMVYFIAQTYWRGQEQPWKLFMQPIFFFQSFGQGIAEVLGGFAYNFGSASIILATQRSSAVAWSVFSGGVYFKEKNLTVKFIALAALVAGIVLFVV